MGPQGEHIVIACLRSYYLCLYSLFSSPDPYLLSFTPRHEYYTMFLGLIRRDCLLLMLRRLCKTCVFRVSLLIVSSDETEREKKKSRKIFEQERTSELDETQKPNIILVSNLM